MQLLTAVPAVAAQVLSLVDDVPQDDDVKAGWLAFGIFIALGLAVAFLGWSLVKQLRKVDAAEEAGLYDPSDKKPPVMLPIADPTDAAAPSEPSQPADERTEQS